MFRATHTQIFASPRRRNAIGAQRVMILVENCQRTPRHLFSLSSSIIARRRLPISIRSMGIPEPRAVAADR
jgi:hypothetical protein